MTRDIFSKIEMGADGPIVLDTVGGLANSESTTREILIEHIFDDDDFKNHLRETARIASASLSDQAQFLTHCAAEIDEYFAGPEKAEAQARQRQLLDTYIAVMNDVIHRFATNQKPNPDAVFWPDPTRGGAKLADVLPVAERYPFIDQSTLIGSAGSCFAIEIAQNLMSRGFNYMCLEKTYDPETGTLVMGADINNPIVQYSCRWGILFNTPSFTQIVENAFGVKPLPEIVVEFFTGDQTVYIDPFREAVVFTSLEGYRAEREKHLANTREVFSKVDVFVMTLGLNEAWRFRADGSYISRNPRNAALTGLLDHRTLTVEENIDYLQRFIDVVREHNPNIKLILTVSPVPFLATGRADKYHVVSANTHSKAVLRVAAQEIVDRNDGVYYFPSYEVVTVCSPEIWTEDQRHIHPDAVARVMATFDEMFLTRAAHTLVKLNQGRG